MKTKILFLSLMCMAFLSGDMSPEFYFNSWEVSNVPGMMFAIDDYYLIFAKGEAAALHEVGHIRFPDADIDLVAFENAVIEYLKHADLNETLGYRISRFYYRDGSLEDCFAELYMWDILYTIPLEFEEFYAR